MVIIVLFTVFRIENVIQLILIILDEDKSPQVDEPEKTTGPSGVIPIAVLK